MIYLGILAAVLLVLVAFITYLWISAKRAGTVLQASIEALQTKYAPIINAEEAVAKANEELTSARTALDAARLQSERRQAEVEQQQQERIRAADAEIASSRETWEKRRAELEQQYAAALQHFEHLKTEVGHFEENLEDISYGLYTPHYSFDASEDYKAELTKVRDRQKLLIRQNEATHCPIKWSVGNSEAEGSRMAKQYQKIMLRAFNAECDAAVAIVTWNNVTKMEERIRKAHEAVNQLGNVMKMSITPKYLDAKLAELRLVHEYEVKRNDEREEQRRIREQIRDEERAQKEMEKAKEAAEKEEARFEKALEVARAEAAKATGAQLDTLNSKVEELQRLLEETKQRERAISQAQLTKSGTVYVISNIGSFGENVFKIGMTRRFEPLDRVHELGDASVPFPFDVHALMASDNAPALELALHSHFESRRKNLVNPRREFYEVTLEEVEAIAKEAGAQVTFTKVAEAREYRETLAKRLAAEQAGTIPSVPEPSQFPVSLFGRTESPTSPVS